ncbi:GNAT family N-acetyltransferase [Streptococcus raffinosi]|uniref:N-acetyltransferase n=1 Tax=Streptococcus raffinosi TaxID=3053355 RepID=A0ABT7LSY5_9STRE|nr:MULTISPECIES: N-acetyltransferase [unclassified Streptococcus]MDL5042643.1 N-acetyltransferase [Streptococcus sp. VTCC 12812]MDM0094209.1 N-acetyltransferase [Streptococcus sp. VTCC 12813]
MTVAIRKVLPEEVEELKVISEDTFRETFAHDNTESQLQAYFDTALSEEVLLDEITHEESRYFFILVDGEKAGFLKTNVGSAQTEQHLDNAFQIQRIYISQAFQGMGLGKQLFEFALQEARDLGCDWAWLGVWERNFKTQIFYDKYGFEKFAEHDLPVGDGKVDRDWLLKLKL